MHHLSAMHGRGAGGLGQARGAAHRVHVLLDGGRHLFHGGGRLLQVGGLLLGARAQVGVARGDLAGARGNRLAAVAHLADDIGQAGAHGIQAGQQAGGITGPQLHGHGQVALGHLLRDLGGIGGLAAQQVLDAARDGPGHQRAQHQRSKGQAQHQPAGSQRLFLGGLGRFGGAQLLVGQHVVDGGEEQVLLLAELSVVAQHGRDSGQVMLHGRRHELVQQRQIGDARVLHALVQGQALGRGQSFAELFHERAYLLALRGQQGLGQRLFRRVFDQRQAAYTAEDELHRTLDLHQPQQAGDAGIGQIGDVVRCLYQPGAPIQGDRQPDDDQQREPQPQHGACFHGLQVFHAPSFMYSK
jgi:hypothetical protein